MASKRSERKVIGAPGVGALLADWMNERGLNPTEMARRAQISRATIYVVLKGQSKNPTTMRQLATGLARRSDTDLKGDPAVEREAARALLTAAGYGALIVEYPVPAPCASSPSNSAPAYDRAAALAEIALLVERVPAASISLADLGRGAGDWDDEDVEYILGRLRRLADRYGRSAIAC